MPFSVTSAAAAAAPVTFSMTAAAAFTMIMAAADMARSVMAAHSIRIIGQGAGQEGFHLGIGISCRTGKETDPRLGQGVPCAASDVAADQDFYALLF